MTKTSASGGGGGASSKSLGELNSLQPTVRRTRFVPGSSRPSGTDVCAQRTFDQPRAGKHETSRSWSCHVRSDGRGREMKRPSRRMGLSLTRHPDEGAGTPGKLRRGLLGGHTPEERLRTRETSRRKACITRYLLTASSVTQPGQEIGSGMGKGATCHSNSLLKRRRTSRAEGVARVKTSSDINRGSTSSKKKEAAG